MKSKEELLQQLKKANKAYKAKLAQKAGYSSVTDYITFLSKTTQKTKPVTIKKITSLVKPTIHIVNIVDKSGSMAGEKITAANNVVRKDMELIKNTPDVNYTYTLCTFSNHSAIKRPYLLNHPSTVKPMPIGAGGLTALYQAVGETLDLVLKMKRPDDKVIVSIITDGGENNSKGFWSNEFRLRNFIKEVESQNFTVTFVGTQYDVEQIERNLNIHHTNTMGYDGTGDGLEFAMNMRTDSLTTYSKSVVKGMDVSKGFYKKTGTL